MIKHALFLAFWWITLGEKHTIFVRGRRYWGRRANEDGEMDGGEEPMAIGFRLDMAENTVKLIIPLCGRTRQY